MDVLVRGSQVSQVLLDAISTMTDGGTLACREVVFDAETGVLRLPIWRLQTNQKCGFLGRRVQHAEPSVRCDVVIRQVSECSVSGAFDRVGSDEVLLLFGVQIRGTEVLLDSVDEDQGMRLFSLRAQIASVDLEIRDAEEE